MNYELGFDVKKHCKIGRGNSYPHESEAPGTVIMNLDTLHYYWFLIKSYCVELEMKDYAICKDSIHGYHYLVTNPVRT